MLFLDPNFVADDQPTTDLIADLYSKLDQRKSGVSNWKAAYNVLAGILALREHGTFKVIKGTMSDDHYKVWKAIKGSSLIGHLLQYVGGKGKNEYRVHPRFTAHSSVRDIRDSDLGYRVIGKGNVSYSSHSAIQHPSQVYLLNGRHVVSCTIKSAQTAVQMAHDYGTEQEIPFPNSYYSLPPYPDDHPYSHEPVGELVVEMWLDYLRNNMKRYGYIGIIPQPLKPDYNNISVVLLEAYAQDFMDWAYQISIPFWRQHKLKAVTFPLHIQHDDWTHIVRGQPIQMLREELAGVS